MSEDAQVAVTPEAQDATNGATPTAAPQAPATPLTPPDAGKVDELPEWARALIGDLRKENASHRTAKKRAETEAEEAARKAAEEQGKFKDLYEAALRKQQEAETEATRLRLEALKSQVAAKVGLPAALASRLQGEDETAIEQDARVLLSSLPRQAVTNDATAGTGGTGAAPSMSEAEIKEFAARMGVKPEFVKPEMFRLPVKGNRQQ